MLKPWMRSDLLLSKTNIQCVRQYKQAMYLMLGTYLVTKRNWRARSLFRIFIQKTLNQCLCLWFHLHAMFLGIGKSECTITDPFEKCHPSSTNICNNINEKRISSCSSESNVNPVKNRLTYERSLANKHFINYYPGVQRWCLFGFSQMQLIHWKLRCNEDHNILTPAQSGLRSNCDLFRVRFRGPCIQVNRMWCTTYRVRPWRSQSQRGPHI